MPGRVDSEENGAEIAIIGGGIIGLILAYGLTSRNIKTKVYEQAHSLQEIGAGVAFTANAIQCMNLINPQIVACLRAVATPNGDENNPNDWLRWVDGYNRASDDPLEEKLLFQLYTGYKGFEGCHRAYFLDELVRGLPKDVLVCGKRLEQIVDTEGGKVVLEFGDKSSARVDAGKLTRCRHLCCCIDLDSPSYWL